MTCHAHATFLFNILFHDVKDMEMCLTIKESKGLARTIQGLSRTLDYQGLAGK